MQIETPEPWPREFAVRPMFLPSASSSRRIAAEILPCDVAIENTCDGGWRRYCPPRIDQLNRVEANSPLKLLPVESR